MLSIFAIFIIELIAFRWGTAKLRSIGKAHGMLTFSAFFSLDDVLSLDLAFLDSHGHGVGAHASHGPEAIVDASPKEKEVSSDVESANDSVQPRTWSTDTTTQLIGIAILEFGVVLHRYEHRLSSISARD